MTPQTGNDATNRLVDHGFLLVFNTSFESTAYRSLEARYEPSFNGPDPPAEKFSRGVQSGKNGIFRGFRPPAPKRLEVTSCRFGRRCVSPSPAIVPKIVSIFAVVKMLRPFESRIFGKVRKRPKSKNRRFLGHPESDRRAVCCLGRQIETGTRPP
jgi:hypothetical protein